MLYRSNRRLRYRLLPWAYGFFFGGMCIAAPQILNAQVTSPTPATPSIAAIRRMIAKKQFHDAWDWLQIESAYHSSKPLYKTMQAWKKSYQASRKQLLGELQMAQPLGNLPEEIKTAQALESLQPGDIGLRLKLAAWLRQAHQRRTALQVLNAGPDFNSSYKAQLAFFRLRTQIIIGDSNHTPKHLRSRIQKLNHLLLKADWPDPPDLALSRSQRLLAACADLKPFFRSNSSWSQSSPIAFSDLALCDSLQGRFKRAAEDERNYIKLAPKALDREQRQAAAEFFDSLDRLPAADQAGATRALRLETNLAPRAAAHAWASLAARPGLAPSVAPLLTVHACRLLIEAGELPAARRVLDSLGSNLTAAKLQTELANATAHEVLYAHLVAQASQETLAYLELLYRVPGGYQPPTRKLKCFTNLHLPSDPSIAGAVAMTNRPLRRVRQALAIFPFARGANVLYAILSLQRYALDQAGNALTVLADSGAPVPLFGIYRPYPFIPSDPQPAAVPALLEIAPHETKLFRFATCGPHKRYLLRQNFGIPLKRISSTMPGMSQILTPNFKLKTHNFAINAQGPKPTGWEFAAFPAAFPYAHFLAHRYQRRIADTQLAILQQLGGWTRVQYSRGNTLGEKMWTGGLLGTNAFLFAINPIGTLIGSGIGFAITARRLSPIGLIQAQAEPLGLYSPVPILLPLSTH